MMNGVGALRKSKLKQKIAAMFQDLDQKKLFFHVSIILSALNVIYASYLFWDYFVDDAFISFRYIQNFLDSHQLVFNLNEYVEGMTNIGWLFIVLAASYILPIALSAKLLGLLFTLLTIFLMYYIIIKNELDKNNSYVYMAPLLVSTNFDFLYFSLTGMETSIFSFTLLVMILAFSKRMNSCFCLFIGFFLYLIHPECILIYPFCILMIMIKEKRYNLIKQLSVFIFLIALFSSMRLYYYGGVFPNTFYSKAMNSNQITASIYSLCVTQRNNLAFPFASIFVWCFVAFGCIQFFSKKFHQGICIFVILFIGLFFCLYAPLDWTGLGRYFAPFIPIAYIVLIVGMVTSVQLFFIKYNVKNIVLNFVLVLIFTGLLGFEFLRFCCLRSKGFMESYPGYVLTSTKLIKPSLWIKEHADKDSIIATRRIGALSYYSNLYIFDYKFGLTNKIVSNLVYQNGKYFDSPADPLLETVWKEIKPDYILEDDNVIENLLTETEGNKESFYVHGIEYKIDKKFELNKEREWVLCRKVR